MFIFDIKNMFLLLGSCTCNIWPIWPLYPNPIKIDVTESLDHESILHLSGFFFYENKIKTSLTNLSLRAKFPNRKSIEKYLIIYSSLLIILSSDQARTRWLSSHHFNLCRGLYYWECVHYTRIFRIRTWWRPLDRTLSVFFIRINIRYRWFLQTRKKDKDLNDSINMHLPCTVFTTLVFVEKTFW